MKPASCSRPAFALIFLALAGCGRESAEIPRLGCDGVLIGATCDDSGCRAPWGNLVEGADTEFCRFVGWQGECRAGRACTISHDTANAIAVFERLAWPLDLRIEAPFTEVVVQPLGTRLTEDARVPVPVGAVYQLEGRAPVGRRAIFVGDCRPEGERCFVEGDRPRLVTVRDEADLLEVTVAVEGGGEVAAGEWRCGADSTCLLRILRGQTVQLEASAQQGFVFGSWNRAECGSATACSFQVTAPITVSASFVPLRRLSLSVDGEPGAVDVNGVTVSLPAVVDLPANAVVLLRARPSVADVFESFSGLPCEMPRFVDECRFPLAGDLAGVLRFHRFFQWASGGLAGVGYETMTPTDGGVVIGLSYEAARDPLRLLDGGTGINFATLRLNEDGGMSLSAMALLPRPSLTLLIQDGQRDWWALVGARTGEPVSWAGVDAGCGGPVLEGYFAGRLDAQLQPLPLVRQLDVSAAGRSLLLSHQSTFVSGAMGRSSLALGATVGGVLPDSGVLSQGVLVAAGDLTSPAYVPLGVGLWPAVASDGERHWALSQVWNLAGHAAPCGRAVAAADGLVLSQLAPDGSCLASSSVVPFLNGDRPAPAALVRVTDGLVGIAEFTRSDGTNWVEVLDVDDSLTPRWRTAVRGNPNLSYGGPSTALAMKTEHEVWSYVSWWIRPGGVSVDIDGLRVRCDGEQTNALLLVRHDRRLSGRATWAHCLTDASATNRFAAAANFTRFADGVLLTARPAVGLVSSRDYQYGSQTLRVEANAEVLLYLTPP